MNESMNNEISRYVKTGVISGIVCENPSNFAGTHEVNEMTKPENPINTL